MMKMGILRYLRILFVLLVININAQTLQTQLGNNITYVVAKDGTGNYTTLQAAINAVSNNSTTKKVIFVKAGTYNEKVEVPATKTNLVIIGENAATTIVTYNDYVGSTKTYNGILTSYNGQVIGTSTSHTLYVAADDFTMMNITIKNAAGDVGQAVAFNSHGDRHFLYHCKLIGYQDTYYTWSDGRFYIKDTYIEGAIDYIFGRGVALFDSCQVHSVRSSSYITAAATDQNFKYGYVFNNCKLTAASGISSVYLGRPWKAYAQTVFMNSEEGSFLSHAGWYQWSSAPANSNTCFYAEYKNCGAGSGTTGRVTWSSQLSATTAANYTLANLFNKAVNPTPYSANWVPMPNTDNLYLIVKKNTTRFITTACFSSATCTATAFANTLTICSGGSATITASSGSSYQWLKDGNNISGATSQTYAATTAGSYTVKVTNSSACIATSPAITITITAATKWYADSDGDGKGDPNSSLNACTQPSGYVADNTDLCPQDANKIAAGNCGCGKTETSCVDCNGTVNGTAVLDICDRCVAGTTKKVACVVSGEAETDACSYDGILESSNTGFKGASYINVPNSAGSAITFNVNATTAGSAILSFRYANGGNADRPASVVVNGVSMSSNLSFPVTGSFTTWKTVDLSITLQKGVNIIKIASTTAEGMSNIDQIGYVSSGLSKASCVITSMESSDLSQQQDLEITNIDQYWILSTLNYAEISLIDIYGKIVEKTSFAGTQKIGMNLPSGIYIVVVNIGNDLRTFKLKR